MILYTRTKKKKKVPSAIANNYTIVFSIFYFKHEETLLITHFLAGKINVDKTSFLV